MHEEEEAVSLVEHFPNENDQSKIQTLERLDAAVRKAMAKKPLDRYQTAGEFADALKDALFPEEKTPVQPDVFQKAKAVPVAVAALFLIATLLVSSVWALYQKQRVEAENKALSAQNKRIEAENTRLVIEKRAKIMEKLEKMTVKDVLREGSQSPPSETAVADVSLALLKNLFDKEKKLSLAIDEAVDPRTDETCDPLSDPLTDMIEHRLADINEMLDESVFEKAVVTPSN